MNFVTNCFFPNCGDGKLEKGFMETDDITIRRNMYVFNYLGTYSFVYLVDGTGILCLKTR